MLSLLQWLRDFANAAAQAVAMLNVSNNQNKHTMLWDVSENETEAGLVVKREALVHRILCIPLLDVTSCF